MKHERHKGPRPPLDAEALERLALFYVGRFATTKAKLATYLGRKIKERGWDGERPPEIADLVARLAGLGYIDDAAFATARAASLQRRGYGERRVNQALYAAGIADDDAADAREQIETGAWDAAMRFAQRKRLGPYAAELPDPPARQKAFAAMMRAGHPMNMVRLLLGAEPGQFPESDSD